MVLWIVDATPSPQVEAILDIHNRRRFPPARGERATDVVEEYALVPNLYDVMPITRPLARGPSGRGV